MSGVLQASPLFDAILFSKIKAQLGGNLKGICSGGAPLSPPVQDFLRVTMCCPVVQGYGLTETASAAFMSTSDAVSPQRYSGSPPPPPPPPRPAALSHCPASESWQMTASLEGANHDELVQTSCSCTSFRLVLAVTDSGLSASP